MAKSVGQHGGYELFSYRSGSVIGYTVTVVDVQHAVRTDIRRNRNEWLAIDLCRASDGNQCRYYLRERRGSIGERGIERELYPRQLWSDIDSAVGSYKAYINHLTGSPPCPSCNAINRAPCSRCHKCSRNLPYVQQPYMRVDADGRTPDGTPMRIKDDTCPPEVRDLVDLLYDEAGTYLREHLSADMKLSDIKPLGNLQPSQIATAQRILGAVRIWLSDYRFMSGSVDPVIMDLTRRWYMAVPQNLGKRPDWNELCLNTQQKVSRAEHLLSVIQSLEEAPVRQGHYASIGASIERLSARSDEYDAIESMVSKSHSKYHSVTLRVQNIYKVALPRQQDPNWFNDVGNVRRLFHGTRNANLLSILQNGLRIQNASNGSMFGRGLYFADVSTKSSQYCTSRWALGQNKNRSGFLLLCDVALGRPFECTSSRHLTEAPLGYDSVWGVKGDSLKHDEFIIYNPNQHRITHLIEFLPR